MSQGTAIDHSLREQDSKPVRVEGDEGRQELVVKDRQLQLLESINESLKKILLILEANT